MKSSSAYTQLIKSQALQFGFSQVGIAKAEELTQQKQQLEQWLNNKYHGEMQYMERYFDMRTDPRLLTPGTQSVIVLLANYFPTEEKKHSNIKIARYAWGQDYHKVLRKRLKQFIQILQTQIGEFQSRIFVDSGPVMEREWAKRAGLGWLGKNTLLINPKKGSYYFLATILTDLQLDYDTPIRDHCGTCRNCIDACPTQAIAKDGYLLDASKCISYLTIELKSDIPESFKGQMQDWVFGCDICQEVCPWNSFSTPLQIEEFNLNHEMLILTKADWMEISESRFNVLCASSPIKRTGLMGMKRNVRFKDK